MSNNVIQTRIQLKNDTLEQWNSVNPVLLKGEIALVAIASADHGSHEVPTYLYKVGDGESNFKTLKWGAAAAADVYAWAKKQNLDVVDIPTMTHDKISDFDTQVDKRIDGKRLATAESVTVLSDKVNTHIDDKKNPHKVTKAQVGLGNVDDKSVNTIRTEFTASGIANGGTNFVTANQIVAAKYASKTEARGYADAKDTAISAAQSAADAAQGTANTAKANAATAQNKADSAYTLAESKTTMQAVLDKGYAVKADLINGTTIVNKATNDSDGNPINTTYATKTDIASLNGAMHFIGAFGVEPKDNKGSALQDGDVYVNTGNHKEFVYSNKQWIELGDTTQEAQDISTLKGQMTTVQGNGPGSIKRALKDAKDYTDTLETNLTKTSNPTKVQAAVRADSATNATNATKATQDSTGAVIADTYFKSTGTGLTHSSTTVSLDPTTAKTALGLKSAAYAETSAFDASGTAATAVANLKTDLTKTSNPTKVQAAVKADSATKATNDGNDNNIVDTYETKTHATETYVPKTNLTNLIINCGTASTVIYQ